MTMTAEETAARKSRWYQERQSARASQRDRMRLLKSAKPAAFGLPDDLRAALMNIDADGQYEAWASEPLVACMKRGLVARMEECADERRALLTGWGEAVREILASAGEAGTATTVQQGVVHEHATGAAGDAQPLPPKDINP